MKTIILCAVFAVALVGCTSRKITIPNGASYESKRFGNKEQIGGISFTDTNGLSFKIESFQSDQVQAIGVAVDAAVKAAIKSVAPVP